MNELKRLNKNKTFVDQLCAQNWSSRSYNHRSQDPCNVVVHRGPRHFYMHGVYRVHCCFFSVYTVNSLVTISFCFQTQIL